MQEGEGKVIISADEYKCLIIDKREKESDLKKYTDEIKQLKEDIESKNVCYVKIQTRDSFGRDPAVRIASCTDEGIRTLMNRYVGDIDKVRMENNVLRDELASFEEVKEMIKTIKNMQLIDEIYKK